MAFFKRGARGSRGASAIIADMQTEAADANWPPVYTGRTSLADLQETDVSAAEWFWLNALGAIAAKTLGYEVPAEWLEWMSPANNEQTHAIAYRAAMLMMAG